MRLTAAPSGHRPAASPFGGAGAGGACVAAALGRRASAEGAGLSRQLSAGLSRAGSAHGGCAGLSRAGSARGGCAAAALPRLSEEGATALIDALTDPCAAAASFDDVCEVLGDVAKLTPVVGAAPAALLANGAAASWLAEKAAAAAPGLAALLGGAAVSARDELGLFTQCFAVTDLAGDHSTALRLGVSAIAALALARAASGAPGAAPARQLSPALSLSDQLAEAAAAALVRRACAPAGAAAPGGGGGGGGAPPPAPAAGPGALRTAARGALAAGELSALERADVAARGALAAVLLGQFRRANRIKKRARAGLAAGSAPGLVLAALEAGVLLHSYSELSAGLGTLLHLGA
ncbi:hypothetical protein HT031_005819 [Scenedesmus sp. PABB004]|nr:hypothetical protein HT031_005819 [Scenedesmus sp. PABB004]